MAMPEILSKANMALFQEIGAYHNMQKQRFAWKQQAYK
jgi:hypothetical protein